MIRKLIDYIKWRWSEEGRQSRLFDRESRRLLLAVVHYDELGDQEKVDEYFAERRKLNLKYPKAKRAIPIEKMGVRPNSISPEEWEYCLITPKHKRTRVFPSKREGEIDSST